MRKKTHHVGVYERQSLERKFKGKPDIAYDICYRHEGKLVWEKVGWLSEGYSPKLAADLRAERMRSMRHGLELPKEKPKTLFKHAAGKYLAWAKDNRAKDGGDQISMYKNHLSPRFDNSRLDGISSFDLERMKSELIKEGYAPGTVKHALVLIRQIFNKSIAWGLYKGENPVKKVTMPILSNQRVRFLSPVEAADLLRALNVKSPQCHDMALLSMHTGMRFGEISNLRVHDIDLNNNLINISYPKNKKPRKAYMTATVRDMFQARISADAKSNDLVFPDDKGNKMLNNPGAFVRVVDALGLNKDNSDPRQKVVFHTLRHTFASWLALQGETIQTISELLGHKTLQMTMRYSHLTPDHKKAAINRFEQGIVSGEKVRSES